MTEADAKQRWCPMVRITSGEPPITNRDVQLAGIVGEEVKCIASDCMFWRWLDTHVDDGAGGTKRDTRTHGFCGIAGSWFQGGLIGYEVNHKED